MRRLFWFSVGAAAGYYAARRGERVVEEARARGLVGNVTLAASTATRLSTGATRAVTALGEAAGEATRQRVEQRRAGAADSRAAEGLAADPLTPAPSREVRP